MMTTQVLRNKVIEETQHMTKEQLTYLLEEIYEMNPQNLASDVLEDLENSDNLEYVSWKAVKDTL